MMFIRIRKHWLLALSAALLAALLAATTVFAEGEEPPAAPAAEETKSEAPAPAESEPAPEPEAAPPAQTADDPPTEEPLTEEPVVEPTLEEPVLESPAEEPVVEPPLEEPATETPAEEPVMAPPQEEPAADVPAEPVLENAPALEAPAETAVEPQATEPAADETAALPDGELLLVDESGAVLDMASVESAEILASGDPWFLVAGKKYRFIDSASGLTCGSFSDWFYCEESLANSITSAIAYINNPANLAVPSDGLVHIEAGTYTEAAITIDGTDLELGKLKGIIGDGSTTTFWTGSLTIQNMAGFTLQGLNLTGGITFTNNSGTVKVTDVKVKNTSGNGLTINGQKGAVVLSNVRADGSASRGAWLTSGTGTYTVSISNSTFNDNCTSTVTSGLDISNFLGAITLDGVSANHNNGNGARIQSDISGATAALTIRNSVFNDNNLGSSNNGLVIEFNTARAVTLENISAMRNINHHGIDIITYGAVILRNVRTEGNRSLGTYIDNSGGAAKPVTVSNSIFSNNTLNQAVGLTIYSYGTITLTSIRAENNTGDGVDVDNCILSSGSCLGSGTVTITSPAAGGEAAANMFNNNGYHGLQVITRGAISLTNFYANENDANSGVYLNNQWTNSSAAVTVGANIPNDAYGSIWYNSAFHNYEDGVEIFSNGAVSISKVNASANRLVNIDIKNVVVPDATPKSVTLNYIMTNGTYAAAIYSTRGIDIETKGNVTASNISADQHAYDGVRIDTCQESGGSCLGSGSVSITSTGTYNSFSNNLRSGIRVDARGAITLKNFVALSNGDSSSYDGVYLSNDYSNGSGAITVDATLPQPFRNEVSGSANYGIQVNSKGAILLGRTLVKDNAKNYGANLNNEDANQPVTVRFSEFSGNKASGLHVVSMGQITLTNVISENNTNSATGASLNNSYTNGGGVTINTSGTFTNRFDYNGNSGLDIQTYGAVQISNTQASGNGNYNIYIDNSGVSPASPKTVTLTNVSASGLVDLMAVNNTGNGVYVNSRGTVTLTNVKVYDHEYDGIYVYLYPPAPGLTQPAVVLSNSISSRNGNNGIYIYGLGSVTLNNTSADNNGYNGAYINNCQMDSGYCTGKGGVSITAPYGKYASFSRNGSSGLVIYTSGAAALTNIKAEENGAHGTSVYQQYVKQISGVDMAVSGNLTVSGSGVPGVFNSNGSQGLYILSFGTVNVSNVEARYNHYYGLSILNEGASAAPGVNLTDINANYNWNNGGVIVQSKGPVTLKGIDVSDNNVLVGAIWDGRRVVDHLSHTAGEDQWWFSINGSYTVNAALNSSSFDALLCLYEADGSLLTCADSGGSGTNALISAYGLTTAGDYYLAVHSADGKAGGYDLTLGSLSNTDYFYTTGLSVDNSYSDTNTAVTISPSTRGYGVKANDNIGDGVVLTSDGLVSISKAWAGNNAYRGIEISNYTSSTEAGVTLNTVYADENGDNGSSLGIYLRSKGSIRWTTGSASGNTYGGAQFYNNESTKFAAVNISGMTANSNENWGAGLEINTKGAVTLTNLIANSNGIGSTGAGVYIDNCQDMGSGCAKNVNVTLTGTLNQFNNNTSYGVYIDSGGLVALTNFTANDNTTSGLRLLNDHLGAGGVSIKRTITGMNEAIGNDTHGVEIESGGAVWVEKLKATDSDYFNLFIKNQNSITPAPGVTVKTTWVERSGSGYEGLYIESYGSVTLDGVKASSNSGQGAVISNDLAPTTPAPVTVLRSVFENNGGYGLSIYASGNILLGGLRARSNGSNGVNAATTDGNVVVSDAYGDNILSFNGTDGPGHGSGLNLYDVYGTISIKRVIATDNSLAGIIVDNQISVNPGGAVTINNVTVANNQRYGICAYVKGLLSVSGAKILDNGRGGSYDGLYVQGYGTSMPLTVAGSTIMGNLGYGIYTIDVTSRSVTSTLNIGNALGTVFP